MKLVPLIVLVAFVALAVFTEVANCEAGPEANPEADPFFFGGWGGRYRGYEGGWGRRWGGWGGWGWGR